MLLRSGVGRLRLVDFDQVTLSSLNRHALATRADVGISKAACLQRHFAEILPEARGSARVQCSAGARVSLRRGRALPPPPRRPSTHPVTLPAPRAQAEVECMNAMFTEEVAGEVLAGRPDFVVDAIDNIDTKARRRRRRRRRRGAGQAPRVQGGPPPAKTQLWAACCA